MEKVPQTQERTLVFATPKEGVLVRHPDTGKPLAAGGEAVERNSYWLRRERDGDVTLGKVPKAPAAAAEAPATTAETTAGKKSKG